MQDSPNWIHRSLIVLSLIASAYAGVMLWVGRDTWAMAIDASSWIDVFVIVGLIGAGVTIRACRWHYYVRCLRWPVPVIHSIVAFMASIALTATPGKSGELVKSALLRTRYSIPISQSAGVLLVERLGDLAAVFVLAAATTSLFTAHASYLFGSFAAIIIAVFLMTRAPIYMPLLSRIGRAKKLYPASLKIIHLLETAQVLLVPAPFVVGLGLALVAWSCEAVAFNYLINKLSASSALLTSFSIYGLSTLAGAVSMAPGGIGGVEAVMIFFLVQLGSSVPTAAMTVALFRVCSLWLFSMIGVGFLFFWMSFIARAKT